MSRYDTRFAHNAKESIINRPESPDVVHRLPDAPTEPPVELVIVPDVGHRLQVVAVHGSDAGGPVLLHSLKQMHFRAFKLSI